jgi:hypothetical protein
MTPAIRKVGKLTGVPRSHAENCAGRTLDGGTPNLVAALPDDLGGMQEFRATG